MMIFERPEKINTKEAIKEFQESHDSENAKYILADFAYVKKEDYTLHYLGHSFEKEPTVKDIRAVAEEIFDSKYKNAIEIFSPENKYYKNTRCAKVNDIMETWKIVRIEDGSFGFPLFTEPGYKKEIGNNKNINIWFSLGRFEELITKNEDIIVRIKTNRFDPSIQFNFPRAGRQELKPCPVCGKYNVALSYHHFAEDMYMQCCNCGVAFRNFCLSYEIPKKVKDPYGLYVHYTLMIWNSLKAGEIKE